MPQYQGIWTLAQAAQLQSTQRWATDPLFENTTLLLQADNAANGAQNNTFLDSSSNNFTITRNGNTTQGTFTPFSQSPGWWSNYFDGTGDYLATPANAAFNVGTASFTLEAWVFPTSFASARALFSFADTNVFYFNTSGLPVYGIFGVSDTTIGSTTVSLNAWTHVAFVRSGSTLTCYLNGISAGSISTSSSIGNSTSGNSIGQHRTGNYFLGYISNLRLANGSAIYTSNFIPSAIPLTITSQGASSTDVKLLTCQSNRFIDNSTANLGSGFALTSFADVSVQAFSPFAPQYQWTAPVIGGSGYFDGSGDFLQTATTTSFAFGTGNFSIEGWVYLTAYNSGACLFGTTQGATTGYYVNLGGDVNSLRVTSNASGTWTDNITVSAGNGVRLNEWTHIALVRNAGSLILYKNGVNVASTSSAASWNFTSPNNAGYIGRVTNGVSTQDLAGWVTSVRVSNTARTITVPTTPYSSDANTVLLTNFTNAGIVDGTMKNNLETVGNAQISTAVVKYGSGSMYFDGTGDNLAIPMTETLKIPASSAFTVEGWFYLTAAQANYRMILSDNAATPTYISINSTGLEAQFGAVPGTIASITQTFNQNTWYHIAVVRSINNVVSIYIDGVARTVTNPTQSNAFLYQGSTLWVARFGTTPAYEWNGYIDDLRVTKGVARYTANFTPPSVALPRQ